MSRPILFIDDGGVLNDNALRAPQWQEHAGAFLSPRLGGAAAAWAEANAVVVPPLWEKYSPVMGAPFEGEVDQAAMWRAYQIDWLRSMAAFAGRPAPDSDDECYAMAREASMYITERVQAAFPGVVETLRRLHAEGTTLYTASGQVSWELEGYLTGMGVIDLFQQRLYGSDLLKTGKGGPHFYDRLFADSGVAPADALVIDDSLRAVQAATRAGARAVLVGATRPPAYDGALIPLLSHIDEVLAAP